MNGFEKLLEKYNYTLPPELIAQKPALPRDSAKLLVFDRENNTVGFDTFFHLGNHLPKNAVLVLNQTRVVPARLEVFKPTGGKAEILYISQDKISIKVISNRRLEIGSSLSLMIGGKKTAVFSVVKAESQFYYLQPNFPLSKLKQVMEIYGKTPLPPYIKHSPLTETQKRKEYQTIFAKQGLSVAAPTASLHFSSRLIKSLKQKGIDFCFVNLNVGLGTFASLKEENVKAAKLHEETYEMSQSAANFLNQAKKQGRPIFAVGTTVVRTLESACDKKGRINKLSGGTTLFIQEGYEFKFVDGLITNFHVPKSSLMMLVSALVGRKHLLNLYQQAIDQKFRFFSFGDGMLIK